MLSIARERSADSSPPSAGRCQVGESDGENTPVGVEDVAREIAPRDSVGRGSRWDLVPYAGSGITFTPPPSRPRNGPISALMDVNYFCRSSCRSSARTCASPGCTCAGTRLDEAGGCARILATQQVSPTGPGVADRHPHRRAPGMARAGSRSRRLVPRSSGREVEPLPREREDGLRASGVIFGCARVQGERRP